MTEDLETLLQEIRACRICRERPDGPCLPHEPRPVLVVSTEARILIASQAPGMRVHETGLPFNDRSGDRLRSWMGVTREEFYDPKRFAIVPMGFCFPGYDRNGGDLPPRRECAPQWRARVLAHMPQVEFILTIGQYAQAWHLAGRRRGNLTETVREWRAILESPASPRVLPLPHPSWRNTAWLKKNPWFEEELVPALKREIRARI
ncbi:uracil-DNA glycosylase family protein [bacterium SGD-2]|nr:uracil-DNA glycosylase family protein [bacterium SGD-2]